ncbi:MAG: ECF transporter S component [Christensenellales bacterium]|jgi:uncharacterized membrane protein
MKRINTRNLAITGILAGLTLLLGLTPLGFINIPPIAITIMCVPVAVGALLEGRGVGLVLGFLFGLTSFLSVSPLKDMMLATNPLATLAVIFIPRLIIPLVVVAVDKAFAKKSGTALSAGVAAAAGSLTNTVGFLGLFYILFISSLPDVVTNVIAAALGINAIIEIIVAPVLVVPIVSAVRKAVIKKTSDDL